MEKTLPADILLVDDDPQIAAATAALLTKKGCRVTVAPSGEDALCRLKDARPALIIMDYRLPGQNGDVITDRIKADPQTADIPVLMCTAQATQALPLGGNPRLRKPDAYLIKPFTAEALLEQVRLLTGG